MSTETMTSPSSSTSTAVSRSGRSTAAAATSTASEHTPSASPPGYTDPGAYLISKGWRPQGDPRGPATRWIDPTKPLVASQEERLVMVRELPGGRQEEVRQLHYTPPAWPMSLDEAIAVQYERDYRESLATSKR